MPMYQEPAGLGDHHQGLHQGEEHPHWTRQYNIG